MRRVEPINDIQVDDWVCTNETNVIDTTLSYQTGVYVTNETTYQTTSTDGIYYYDLPVQPLDLQPGYTYTRDNNRIIITKTEEPKTKKQWNKYYNNTDNK